MKSNGSDPWQRLVLHEFIEKVDPSFHFEDDDREAAEKPIQRLGSPA